MTDADKLLSRRGPNQEVSEHRELDKMASHAYPGYRLQAIGAAPVAGRAYVREDALQGVDLTRDGLDERRLRASGETSAPSRVGKQVGKGVLWGLLNAVLPIKAGWDAMQNIRNIHQQRVERTSPWGKSAWWSVLAGAIETSQLVATIATAVGIVSALVAFIPGAQAAAAVATVAGVIATIAHAVTLGLRSISASRLGFRWRNSTSTMRQAQSAKKFWGEIGALAANGIGVLGGGLLGGFDLSAAATAVSEGANTGATAISAGVGQIYNTDADMATVLGEFWQDEVKSKVDLTAANLHRYRVAKDLQQAREQRDGLQDGLQGAEEASGMRELDEPLQELPERADSKSEAATKDTGVAERLDKAEGAAARPPLNTELEEKDLGSTPVPATKDPALLKSKGVVQARVSAWIKKTWGGARRRLRGFKKAARLLYKRVRAKLIGWMVKLLGIKDSVQAARADFQEHLQVEGTLAQESEAAAGAMETVAKLESKIGQ